MEGEMKTCAIQLMCPLSIFIPGAVLHFWSTSVWVSKVKKSTNRNKTSLCVGGVRKKEVVCLSSHLAGTCTERFCLYRLKSLVLWDRECLLELVVMKSSVLCFSRGANSKNEVLQCTSAREQHVHMLRFRQCREKNWTFCRKVLSKEKSYVE